jgi:hypothetical protein
MKMKRFLLLCLAVLAAPSLPLSAQKALPELSGYVSDMAAAATFRPGGEWTWENTVHLRLNAGWQFAEHWRMDAGMRNRYIEGNLQGKKSELRAAFDRLYLTFEQEQWNLQLGRQRINWGQTLVWNPNDIFNTYSFFDFDYPERPGCDAFRATRYHSPTASTELAVSLDAAHRTTAALLHRWNRNSFDYQVLGGLYAESDAVAGGAWSGDFGGLNFRGEVSLFLPLGGTPADSSFAAAASAGLDYMFPGSLMLQAEVLYNKVSEGASAAGLMDLYGAPLSAKRLSAGRWNLFAQASRPLGTRVQSSLSALYFAGIRAYYAGFTLDCSLAQNLDLSFITQYFASAGTGSAEGLQILLAFARLKYSF